MSDRVPAPSTEAAFHAITHAFATGKPLDAKEVRRLLEAARAEGRQEAVRRIRRRAVLASDDYSDDEGPYGEIGLGDLMEILNEVEGGVAGLNASESRTTPWPGNTATIHHTDPRRSDMRDASESGQQEQSDDPR